MKLVHQRWFGIYYSIILISFVLLILSIYNFFFIDPYMWPLIIITMIPILFFSTWALPLVVTDKKLMVPISMTDPLIVRQFDWYVKIRFEDVKDHKVTKTQITMIVEHHKVVWINRRRLSKIYSKKDIEVWFK